MSIDELVPVRERWLFTRPKLYGWLVGLGLAVFGGLMCTVPVGAYLGVPAVILGLVWSLSFSVSVSATSASPRAVVPLVVLGLALLVVGRYYAPIVAIIQSFETGQEVQKRPGVLASFGFPLMLIGTHLVQLVTPWIRDPDRFSYFRGAVSLVLIEGASLALLVGSILTACTGVFLAQPYWVWLAVPLAVGTGSGLRRRWRGMTWILLAALTGATLPLTWVLLVRAS